MGSLRQKENVQLPFFTILSKNVPWEPAGPSVSHVLKESAGGAGPVDRPCGRSVNGFAFCVTVSGWGKFMKIRHEHRVRSQLLTIPSYSLHSGEWAFLSLSMYDLFTITIEKGRQPQTQGWVNVLKKRNWRIKKKPLQRLAKVRVLNGVWVCM